MRGDSNRSVFPLKLYFIPIFFNFKHDLSQYIIFCSTFISYHFMSFLNKLIRFYMPTATGNKHPLLNLIQIIIKHLQAKILGASLTKNVVQVSNMTRQLTDSATLVLNQVLIQVMGRIRIVMVAFPQYGRSSYASCEPQWPSVSRNPEPASARRLRCSSKDCSRCAQSWFRPA